MPSPRISAIIPLYNGAKYIEQAIASVLAQTARPIETIVVDDGSTDDGAAIVERLAATHPLVLLRKENGGQSSARNFGIRHSTGELIALLDQDDVWYPDHLAELAKPFEEPRSRPLAWVYSNLDEIDERGEMVIQNAISRTTTEHPKQDIETCLAHDMFVLPSASLISRAAFDAVGGFDEALSGYEDDDLFLRLFRAGYDNVYLEDALSQWRIYRASSSWSPRMAKSRRVYADKLLRLYPDDPVAGRHYTRDLLAPRFHDLMAEEYRKALRTGNEAAIGEARANLEFIRGHLRKPRHLKERPENLTISAIIPLYNGAPYIEEALASVLTQSLKPAEIIVVDDGSTDDGAAIVERLAARQPIRLLRKPNGGQSQARNHGIAHAGGDLIALLDQDDAWYPHHLEVLIEPFLEPRARELGWSYSNLDEVDHTGLTIRRSFLSALPAPHPKIDLGDCLGGDMYVLPSASLISRAAFEAVGGFDERLSGYEDDDLFLRLFQAGYDNVYVNESLSRWRIYPLSTSYSPRMGRSRALFARKLFARYPDDPRRDRYYSRDRLAPRFLPHMLKEYRDALETGDPALIEATVADLRYLRPFLKPRPRALLMLLLALGPLSRPLLNVQPWLRPLYRRAFR